jgi:hypothetical protein
MRDKGLTRRQFVTLCRFISRTEFTSDVGNQKYLVFYARNNVAYVIHF